MMALVVEGVVACVIVICVTIVIVNNERLEHKHQIKNERYPWQSYNEDAGQYLIKRDEE